MEFTRVLIAVGLALACEAADESPTDATQAEESTKRVLQLAQQYEFYADAQRMTRFDLHPQSVLKYTNPVQGEVYGSVFVWTRQGRPIVVGAIFDYRTANRIDSEFHSLSNGMLVGVRDDRPFWNPTRAGVDFRPLPLAPNPASTAVGRLRQMRDLANNFTLTRDHPEQKNDVLRQMSQPIYRYSCAAEDVLDGAIFVFVEGTDPEAFLLIEATAAKPTWRYALARMNLVEFWADYKGQPVWHVEPVGWDTVFEKQEPYAIVREKPRRGFTRSQ